MGLLQKIEGWLDGKKTYLVMLSGICMAIVGYLDHTLTLPQAIAAVWAALGLGAVRSAIGPGTPAK